MLTSLYTAMSGISANSQAINVIGNNLANINTTAYKGSRTSFGELLGGISYGSDGNPIPTGLGAVTARISPQYTQGSIQTTGRSTDVAMSGNGFFVLSTGSSFAYTRAGNFSFNGLGELVSTDGFTVAGYAAIGGVIDTNNLSALTMQGSRSLPPQATDAVSITANLDNQAATNSVFSTGVQMFDSLGLTHTITFSFTKTGTLGWDWTATLPAVDLGGDIGDPAAKIGSGSFTFDSSGVLGPLIDNVSMNLVGFSSGASDASIEFQIRDSKGISHFTGNARASAVSSVTANGYTSSTLRDIAIDGNGVIRGIYDNGQVTPLAQLAIANFNNPEGLLKFTGNALVKAASSGEPSIGIAHTGGRGTVNGNALELSNVDIAEQFTSMIIAQRGYQANSRVITTTDELYQEAINLKR